MCVRNVAEADSFQKLPADVSCGVYCHRLACARRVDVHTLRLYSILARVAPSPLPPSSVPSFYPSYMVHTQHTCTFTHAHILTYTHTLRAHTLSRSDFVYPLDASGLVDPFALAIGPEKAIGRGIASFVRRPRDPNADDNDGDGGGDGGKRTRKRLQNHGGGVGGTKDGEVALSAALSLALCYCDRRVRENLESLVREGRPRLRARVLVMQACGDQASQYVQMMNCIFAAKKSKVLLDTCVLGHADSVHLKQASNLTSGVYIRPKRERVKERATGNKLVLQDKGGQTALLHHMILSFLPDHFCRQHLNMPTEETVDFRASCFCHHELKDTAFVCSVCLTPRCTFRRGGVVYAMGA